MPTCARWLCLPCSDELNGRPLVVAEATTSDWDSNPGTDTGRSIFADNGALQGRFTMREHGVWVSALAESQGFGALG